MPDSYDMPEGLEKLASRTSIRGEILDTARTYVTKDRMQTHGAPADSFKMIAAVWSARLGITVTPAQVCLLMGDLKACRAWMNPWHLDNWVDLAGYAACGGEIATAVPK